MNINGFDKILEDKKNAEDKSDVPSHINQGPVVSEISDVNESTKNASSSLVAQVNVDLVAQGDVKEIEQGL
mgnify:CR=1 FL=1